MAFLPEPGSSALDAPTPTASLRLGLPGRLPASLQEGLQAWSEQDHGRQIITGTANAHLWLTPDPIGEPAIERYYVPVTHFASLVSDVPASDLVDLWLGTAEQPPLAVDEETAAGLGLVWGEPVTVEVVPSVEDVASLLQQEPDRLGIVPFDHLTPQLQALTISGNDITDNRFSPEDYPLALRLYLDSVTIPNSVAEDLQSYLIETGLHTNRDPKLLTVLVMTGVTAMARTTAYRMEQQGYGYPAEVIGPELSAADLTHISNEVPFVPDCQADPTENNIVLCSRPEYLTALRDVGVDLVGLTGNHLNDFGYEAALWSLQFYAAERLPTYGGGANVEEALKPLVMEHNGNRLAFLGVNAFGPPAAWAGPENPGSAPYSFDLLSEAIDTARNRFGADLVLVEFQWEESYDALPLPYQRDNFRRISAAGADIVTGVQSHVPQAIEFGDGGPILYGLGNLFFDQMWSLPTREGMIARHTIYQGSHLSMRLLTTILEDYAQPRWATEPEREALLSRIYAASGW